MPWSPKDAGRHNKKAKSGKASRQWSDVANSETKDVRFVRPTRLWAGGKRNDPRYGDSGSPANLWLAVG